MNNTYKENKKNYNMQSSILKKTIKIAQRLNNNKYVENSENKTISK